MTSTVTFDLPVQALTVQWSTCWWLQLMNIYRKTKICDVALIDLCQQMFTNESFYLQKEEEKDLVEVCRRLMANLHDGNCTLVWQHRNGKIQFDCVEINGKGKAPSSLQKSAICPVHSKVNRMLYKPSASKLIHIYLTVKTSLATKYYEEITKVWVYVQVRVNTCCVTSLNPT